LAGQGPLLGEPYTRQLDGKLRELRFYLNGLPVRVTYWIAQQHTPDEDDGSGTDG
jgi:hypothetical protein